MRKMIFLLTCVAFGSTLIACSASKIPSKFDVAVSFGSMASGPVSDAFLKSFIKSFSKRNAVKITGYKAAGCGREGEFNILFDMSGLKPATKSKFITELNTCVQSQEKKNKGVDEHSGSVSVEYNKTKEDYSYCREGITAWK